MLTENRQERVEKSGLDFNLLCSDNRKQNAIWTPEKRTLAGKRAASQRLQQTLTHPEQED
jgi:hypothetical protein